jgi:hypothetical protein
MENHLKELALSLNKAAGSHSHGSSLQKAASHHKSSLLKLLFMLQ